MGALSQMDGAAEYLNMPWLHEGVSAAQGFELGAQEVIRIPLLESHIPLLEKIRPMVSAH
jgi:hypothetical protein